jgi:hypothetical protein
VKNIVASVLTGLKTFLALELSEPTFERGLRQPRSARKKVDFIIVGSGNAGRTSRWLHCHGYSCTAAFAENWRATPATIFTLLTKVKDLLTTNSVEAVVLQLYDDSIYFGKTDYGGIMPAIKEDDGKYHIRGGSGGGQQDQAS